MTIRKQDLCAICSQKKGELDQFESLGVVAEYYGW